MTSIEKRLAQSELVMGLDEDAVAARGVACPVDWCEAYAFRFARCGDADGPFEGVHQGRLNAERVVVATEARRRRATQTENLPLAAGFSQLLRDLENQGDIPGVEGPRLKRQRAAREKLGMQRSAS